MIRQKISITLKFIEIKLRKVTKNTKHGHCSKNHVLTTCSESKQSLRHMTQNSTGYSEIFTYLR